MNVKEYFYHGNYWFAGLGKWETDSGRKSIGNKSNCVIERFLEAAHVLTQPQSQTRTLRVGEAEYRGCP